MLNQICICHVLSYKWCRRDCKHRFHFRRLSSAKSRHGRTGKKRTAKPRAGAVPQIEEGRAEGSQGAQEERTQDGEGRALSISRLFGIKHTMARASTPSTRHLHTTTPLIPIKPTPRKLNRLRDWNHFQSPTNRKNIAPPKSVA